VIFIKLMDGPPVFNVIVEVLEAEIFLLTRLDAILSSKGFSGSDRGFVSALLTLTDMVGTGI
jgi:hypothetical protein